MRRLMQKIVRKIAVSLMSEEILTLIIVMNMKRHKRVARKLPAYLISLPGYQLRWCPAILCSIATIDRMCDCWMCDYLMRIWRFYLRFVRAGICVRTLCCSVKCDMLYDYVRADEDHRSASASRSLLGQFGCSLTLELKVCIKNQSIEIQEGRTVIENASTNFLILLFAAEHHLFLAAGKG